MGWCTDLYCNITFNRKTYNAKFEVESDLDEINSTIKYNERRLNSLALMTEPNKFFNDPDGDLIFMISNEVKESLEFLEEAYIEKFKLEMLLDNWDKCHDPEGLAIDPPENIHWDTAFLSGDFVNSKKYPNANG